MRSAATPARAIAEYRKAIALDPTFVPAYANLADLYRARGADGEAVAVLREGLARNPRAAVLHHALGLALVRQKQTAESLKALRAAADARAGQARRFAYVYAVALERRGPDRGGAEGAGRGAQARIRTIATCCRGSRTSRRRPAIATPRWATSSSCASSIPENAEYAQMAQQIEGGLPR